MAETLAFVIHQRPFHDNDAIINLLTEKYGLLSVLAKGSRGQSYQSQQLRACLQPATLLEIDIRLSSNSLCRLDFAESISVTPPLNNLSFIYISYINEIVRLFLNEQIPLSDVFLSYRHCVIAILKGEEQELAFRALELALIKSSRIGLSFEVDANAHCIDASAMYQLDIEQGFNNLATSKQHATGFTCQGDFIQRLALNITTAEDNIALKQLFQRIKDYLYPTHTLKSRELYQSWKQVTR